MSMRVIAGYLRHRELFYPENNKNIRPTKDRIREAFFSAIGDITNLTFLDLFAGCGSMGIEAISRGAKESYFIDNSLESLKYVKENIKKLDIKKSVVIYKDALEALKMFKEENKQFDVIYIDPPYESDIYNEILSYIFSNNLARAGAIVAFEANKVIETNPLWYQRIKEYHYGEITVTVMRL